MTSRKTYDNTARDKFARDAGIDIGGYGAERPSTWDEFHDMEVAELKSSVADLKVYCAEWRRLRAAAVHRGSIWKLAALIGWGMFAIACLTRYL